MSARFAYVRYNGVCRNPGKRHQSTEIVSVDSIKHFREDNALGRKYDIICGSVRCPATIGLIDTTLDGLRMQMEDTRTKFMSGKLSRAPSNISSSGESGVEKKKGQGCNKRVDVTSQAQKKHIATSKVHQALVDWETTRSTAVKPGRKKATPGKQSDNTAEGAGVCDISFHESPTAPTSRTRSQNVLPPKIPIPKKKDVIHETNYQQSSQKRKAESVVDGNIKEGKKSSKTDGQANLTDNPQKKDIHKESNNAKRSDHKTPLVAPRDAVPPPKVPLPKKKDVIHETNYQQSSQKRKTESVVGGNIKEGKKSSKTSGQANPTDNTRQKNFDQESSKVDHQRGADEGKALETPQDKHRNCTELANLINAKDDQPPSPDEDGCECGAQIPKLKHEIEMLTKENRSLRTLNVDLQSRIMGSVDKVKATITSIEESARVNMRDRMDRGLDMPVGFVDASTDQIHAGAGHWMNKLDYDLLRTRRRLTPQSFIGRVAMLIFGERVMRKSSVTGTISNANAKRLKGTQRPIPKPALNPSGLEAVISISRHWMQEVGVAERDIAKHLYSCRTYIAKKISDLNRPSRVDQIRKRGGKGAGKKGKNVSSQKVSDESSGEDEEFEATEDNEEDEENEKNYESEETVHNEKDKENEELNEIEENGDNNKDEETAGGNKADTETEETAENAATDENKEDEERYRKIASEVKSKVFGYVKPKITSVAHLQPRDENEANDGDENEAADRNENEDSIGIDDSERLLIDSEHEMSAQRDSEDADDSRDTIKVNRDKPDVSMGSETDVDANTTIMDTDNEASADNISATDSREPWIFDVRHE